MRNMNLGDFLTTGEAAQEAGISIKTVSYWCEKHPEMIAGKLGGASIIYAREWRKFINGRIFSSRRRRPQPNLIRQQAKARGDRFYLVGEPCVNGHNSPRYTSTGHCRACVREQAQRRRVKETAREYDRIWAKLDDGARNEAVRLGLQANHSALRYASLQRIPDLQIKALRTEAQRKIRRGAAI